MKKRLQQNSVNSTSLLKLCSGSRRERQPSGKLRSEKKNESRKNFAKRKKKPRRNLRKRLSKLHREKQRSSKKQESRKGRSLPRKKGLMLHRKRKRPEQRSAPLLLPPSLRSSMGSEISLPSEMLTG